MKACDDRLAALLPLLCAHFGLHIGEALAGRRSDVRPAAHRPRQGRQTPERAAQETGAGRADHPLLGPAPNGYFYGTRSQVSRLMRDTCATAGLAGKWRGLRAARKACGTRLSGTTGDFTRVRLFLSHASVDTTRRSVAVCQDDVSAEVKDFGHGERGGAALRTRVQTGCQRNTAGLT